MNLFSLIAIILLAFMAIHDDHLVAGEEIIVFVHGLIGFGRDELFGLGYWGFPLLGGTDLIDWMQKKTGLRTFEASVGPLSSNHDRACELYAQIMGTKTDYGKAHSLKNAHARFGKDYSKANPVSYYRQGGFFPQWNENNRIHFIGHSMGGPTIRYLERMIQLGSEEEMKASYASNETAMSQLFQTGLKRDWIASVTTISSPLNGSPSPGVGGASISSPGQIQNLAALIASATNNIGVFNENTNGLFLYDFDLEHFGSAIPAPPKDFSWSGLKDFLTKLGESKFFDPTFTDTAMADLSSIPSREFNSKGPRAFKNTYYFAMAGYTTIPCLFNLNDQCADLAGNPLLGISATLNGNLDDLFGNNPRTDVDGFVYGNEWEKNDGLVPFYSSKGPMAGVNPLDFGAPREHPTNFFGQYKYDKNSIKPGQWYWSPVKRDHVQIIGLSLRGIPLDMYEHISKNINSIKSSTATIRKA